MPQDEGWSRRDFLRGISASAALTKAALGTQEAQAQEVPPRPKVDVPVLPAAGAPLALTVNGAAKTLAVEPRKTLLDLLRQDLGLTGPKEVCDRGACGACTVIRDGQPIVACMVLAHDCAGSKIETIEGIGSPENPHPLQRAFVECDALQCGFCTPGMVTSLKCLLDREPSPSLDAIKKAVAGNVCRCGTYPRIFEAAQKAAKASQR